jgi:hypothetical protein
MHRSEQDGADQNRQSRGSRRKLARFNPHIRSRKRYPRNRISSRTGPNTACRRRTRQFPATRTR